MEKGVIYLIQPKELIGTCTYKIVCLRNHNHDGFKDSRIICMIECDNQYNVKYHIKTDMEMFFIGDLITGNITFIKDEFLKFSKSTIDDMSEMGYVKANWVSLTDDDFTQARRIYSIGNILMKTVDSFKFEDVDLIKIDVEGFEMNVLRGAKDTLKDCNFLMIELNNNSKKYNSSNNEIEKYIEEHGFTKLIDKWPDKVFVRNN